MRFPWWLKSYSVLGGAIGIILCFIPITRKALHQAELGAVQFQGLMQIVLRFKTEARRSKLSEDGQFKEES